MAAATERRLGADQSNTSVVLDEAVLLKAYRRLHAGLNPELELVAFLSEEAGFPAVPPLAGYVELVSRERGTGDRGRRPGVRRRWRRPVRVARRRAGRLAPRPGRGEPRVRHGGRGGRRRAHRRSPCRARLAPGHPRACATGRHAGRDSAAGRRRPAGTSTRRSPRRAARPGRCCATSRRGSPRRSRSSTGSPRCRGSSGRTATCTSARSWSPPTATA